MTRLEEAWDEYGPGDDDDEDETEDDVSEDGDDFDGAASDCLGDWGLDDLED